MSEGSYGDGPNTTETESDNRTALVVKLSSCDLIEVIKLLLLM